MKAKFLIFMLGIAALALAPAARIYANTAADYPSFIDSRLLADWLASTPKRFQTWTNDLSALYLAISPKLTVCHYDDSAHSYSLLMMANVGTPVGNPWSLYYAGGWEGPVSDIPSYTTRDIIPPNGISGPQPAQQAITGSNGAQNWNGLTKKFWLNGCQGASLDKIEKNIGS